MPSDRRAFLRHAMALGLLSPVAAAWGCGDRSPDAGSGGTGAIGSGEGPVIRPTVIPGEPGTVHVVAPMAEPPVAYLSRGDMRVYLDPAYRDWAEHRLAAYVSVTTGLWRIPRPEDDPRVPIIPGDALREFEVVDLRLRDPGMVPTEGDVRLRLGSPVSVRLDLSCVPVGDEEAWVSAAGPVVVRRREGPAGTGGREDYSEVARGLRHADAACTAPGEAVRLLSWVCPAAADA